MNLNELIKKNERLSIEESLFVIKEYIKIRKGVEIVPVLDPMLMSRFLMNQLTDYAVNWLRSNNF